MRRYSPLVALVVTACALAAPARAQEKRTVYLVSPVTNGAASEAGALMERYMGLSPEALRLYLPTEYVKKPLSLDLRTPGSIAFEAGAARVLERGEKYVLNAYEVVLRGLAPLPKPDRVVTVRFSLSQLVKSADATSPGLYALKEGIGRGSFARGSAWLESLSYDGKGNFNAQVALIRR
jgi:hypothetical protein